MQATCERGLALMEECHLKVLEELQCLHQLEVERLLMEGGRLLEEESVATATGEVWSPLRSGQRKPERS